MSEWEDGPEREHQASTTVHDLTPARRRFGIRSSWLALSASQTARERCSFACLVISCTAGARPPLRARLQGAVSKTAKIEAKSVRISRRPADRAVAYRRQEQELDKGPGQAPEPDRGRRSYQAARPAAPAALALVLGDPAAQRARSEAAASGYRVAHASRAASVAALTAGRAEPLRQRGDKDGKVVRYEGPPLNGRPINLEIRMRLTKEQWSKIYSTLLDKAYTVVDERIKGNTWAPPMNKSPSYRRK